MTEASKRTWNLEVPGMDGLPASYVPVGLIRGRKPGPSAAVVAGVHGTEWVGQDAVAALWQELTPELVRGEMTVVFAADVEAAVAGMPGANPIDRRNLNRFWPGSESGSWSERLEFRLWRELLAQPEVVIDIHGGEWTEEASGFGLVHRTGDRALDERILELAQAMGFPYISVTEGLGTLSGAVARDGRLGLAMEVGGGGRRPPEDVRSIVEAVRGALAAAEVLPETGPSRKPTSQLLDQSEMVRSPAAGVMVPRVTPGQQVAQGDPLATIHDFDGTLRQTVVAPAAGVVLLRSVARVVSEGSLLASLGWGSR